MLRRESRLRRWLLAGAAGAVLGALVGLRLGWWLAPLAVAVTVAGLLVWDHRSGLLASWPGDQGCHRLAAAAARLERRGWAVLHSLAVANQDPGRPAYLLVGPGGVFVVEHQVWPAGDRVTTSPPLRDFNGGCVPADGADPGWLVAGCRHGTPEVALVGGPGNRDLVAVLRRRIRVLAPGEVDRVASTARHLFAPSAGT